MHLEIKDFKEWTAILRSVRAIPDKKSNVPILATAKIEATTETVRLTVTDLETTVIVKLDDVMAVKEEGSICVPLKAMLDLSKGRYGSIIASYDPSYAVQMGAARIPCLSMTEFPIFEPDVEEAGEAGQLATPIKKVLYAKGESDTRYVMNGLLFDFPNGNVVGTDGHRMAVQAWSLPKLKVSAILPNKSVKFLSSINSLVDLYVAYEKRAVEEKKKKKAKEETEQAPTRIEVLCAAAGRYIVVIRLVDGQYPNYKQVIPERDKFVEVHRATLMSILKESQTILKGDKDASIVLDWDDKTMRVANARQNSDVKYENALPVVGASEPLLLGVNARYLYEAIEPLTTETVKLEFAENLAPIKIVEGGYTAVVMPMRTDYKSPLKSEEDIKEDEEEKKDEDQNPAPYDEPVEKASEPVVANVEVKPYPAISVVEFTVRAIVKLRKRPYKGIHTVYSGFAEAFSKYYPNVDFEEIKEELVRDNLIVAVPDKYNTGEILYLADDLPAYLK